MSAIAEVKKPNAYALDGALSNAEIGQPVEVDGIAYTKTAQRSGSGTFWTDYEASDGSKGTIIARFSAKSMRWRKQIAEGK